MTRKTSGNDHLGTPKPLRHVILRETYKVCVGGRMKRLKLPPDNYLI